MGPVTQSDGHDAPWLVSELVPALAAVGDDVVVVPEDAVREPIVPEELPDVLDGVQLRRLWRDRDEGDVVGKITYGLFRTFAPRGGSFQDS